VKVILAVAGVLLLFGSFFVLVDSEDMTIQTGTGERVEADVFLDAEKVGFSDDGSIGIDTEDLKEAETVRLKGTKNGISYDLSYPVSKVNITEEKSVLEIASQKIGYHKLRFYIKSNNKSLNGVVSNEGQRIGQTNNASIYVSPEKLKYGDLTLNGTYNGSNFSIYYNYEESMRDSRNLDFYIEKNELKSIIFDARSLDSSKIEQNVLDYVNDVRNGEDVPQPSSPPTDDLSNFSIEEFEPLPEITEVNPVVERKFVQYNMPDYLDMNNRLRADARAKSEEMKNNEYFSHESPSGTGVFQRLKNKEIFFITGGENLYKTGEIPYYWDEEDVARSIVRGWEDSPGHRSLMVDRDRLYSDAGLGVSCTEKTCYATLVTAQMMKVTNTYLEDDYCTYADINNPGWSLNYPTDVNINMKVDGSVDAYLVDNGKKEYEECLDRDRIDSFKEFERTEGFEYSYEDADQGDAVVISSNEDSNVTMKINYSGDQYP